MGRGAIACLGLRTRCIARDYGRRTTGRYVLLVHGCQETPSLERLEDEERESGTHKLVCGLWCVRAENRAHHRTCAMYLISSCRISLSYVAETCNHFCFCTAVAVSYNTHTPLHPFSTGMRHWPRACALDTRPRLVSVIPRSSPRLPRRAHPISGVARLDGRIHAPKASAHGENDDDNCVREAAEHADQPNARQHVRLRG